MNLVVLFLLLFLTACLPIPQISKELNLEPISYRSSPLVVQNEYVVLDGYQEPHTPQKYNKTAYARFYLEEDANTVAILMPGIFASAGNLSIIARQMVAATPGLEVWVIDRRSGLLEDRSRFSEAITKRDPDIAYKYYLSNFGKEGGFQPFDIKKNKFIYHWGLETHLRDLHIVIKRARANFKTVILGGHSLGASIVAFYAAFDFGEMISEPGYKFIDGLFLIDGVLGRTGAFNISQDGINIAGWNLIPGKTSTKQERGDAILPNMEPYYFKRELLQLYARFRPNELAKPAFFSYPITNRAALGVSIDDDYSSSIVFSSSVGHAINAKYSGNIAAVLLGDWDGIYSKSVVGVADGFDFVDWQKGENSDLDIIAKYSSMKDFGNNEWYFPLRLFIDMLPHELGLEHSQGFVPNKEVNTATLAVGASRGLVRTIDGFSAYTNSRVGSQFSLYVVPGFTHFDIIQAKNNPAISLFKIWLSKLKTE